MAILRVMVGLPGSGKTTLARAMDGFGLISPDEVCKELRGGYYRINRDAGDEVWRTVVRRVVFGLSRGQNMVVDTGHATVAERKTWLDLASLGIVDRVEAIVVLTDEAECARRVKKRGRAVDATLRGLAKRAKEFVKPTAEEGFGYILEL